MSMIGLVYLNELFYDERVKGMTSCSICESSFGIFVLRHTCRMCRSPICETCSICKNRVELQEYRWCKSWISRTHPSFVSFLMHENDVRMCVRCASWDHTTMRAMWKVIQNGIMEIKDIGSWMKTNRANSIMSNVFLQRIRTRQKHAVRLHTPITSYESSLPLVPMTSRIIRDRWKCIQSNKISIPPSVGCMDMVELMWKLRSKRIQSQNERRTVFGMMWSNRSSKQVRLLYSLAHLLGIDFIPESVSRVHEMSDQRRNAWTEWVQNGSDVGAIPSEPCPIWGESLSVHKHTITIKSMPSATAPLLMRWGSPPKGLLWKRESGSVDRMIEYSIALCSEALRESGILAYPQTWYDVAMLQRDVVAIQIVPNCVSLSSLVEQKKSILEYLCDTNDGISVSTLRKRLMESIAFSSAISWFYGFGDRHLDNIMVSNDAQLFHIDFGFCFGREPKFGVPRIRITQDMVHSLGESYWKQCVQKGQAIMDWLRTHIPTLRMITDIGIGDSKSHIHSHWDHIESDTSTFEALATESIYSFTTNIHDFFHSKAQSFRSMSSVWNTITQG